MEVSCYAAPADWAWPILEGTDCLHLKPQKACESGLDNASLSEKHLAATIEEF